MRKMATVQVPKEELMGRAKTLNADAVWLAENIDYGLNLRKTYSDQYVAVDDKRVIDADKDLRRLVSRLKQKHPLERVGSFYITYITKTKIDLII